MAETLRALGDARSAPALARAAEAHPTGPLRVALYRAGRAVCFRANLTLPPSLEALGPAR